MGGFNPSVPHLNASLCCFLSSQDPWFVTAWVLENKLYESAVFQALVDNDTKIVLLLPTCKIGNSQVPCFSLALLINNIDIWRHAKHFLHIDARFHFPSFPSSRRSPSFHCLPATSLPPPNLWLTITHTPKRSGLPGMTSPVHQTQRKSLSSHLAHWHH